MHSLFSDEREGYSVSLPFSPQLKSSLLKWATTKPTQIALPPRRRFRPAHCISFSLTKRRLHRPLLFVMRRNSKVCITRCFHLRLHLCPWTPGLSRLLTR